MYVLWGFRGLLQVNDRGRVVAVVVPASGSDSSVASAADPQLSALTPTRVWSSVVASHGVLSACAQVLQHSELSGDALRAAVGIVTRVLDEGLHRTTDATLAAAREAVMAFIGTAPVPVAARICTLMIAVDGGGLAAFVRGCVECGNDYRRATGVELLAAWDGQRLLNIDTEGTLLHFSVE